MNLIPKIAELLGVEIGEEFDIILENCTPSCFNPFKLTEDGLSNVDMCTQNNYLHALLIGEYTIKKIPFKPKRGDMYWSWHNDLQKAYRNCFDTYMCDYTSWKIGNCFRTKEEAETKGKALMESILKEYRENETSN